MKKLFQSLLLMAAVFAAMLAVRARASRLGRRPHAGPAADGTAPSTATRRTARRRPIPTSSTPRRPSSTRSTPTPRSSCVMHVGDIHSGKQFCTEAYDRSIFDLWTQFQDPLVYTPGDNEWTDCHKAPRAAARTTRRRSRSTTCSTPTATRSTTPSGDPVANLDAGPLDLLPAARRDARAAQEARAVPGAGLRPPHPTDAKFVENVMWVQSNVLFVTINLPGGSNNDTDIWYGAPTMTRRADRRRSRERTGADLRWLDARVRDARRVTAPRAS